MNPKTIEEYLQQDESKDILRILTAGSVDDGKSTLIGRLMFDSKQLYEDQLFALERDSRKLGHAGDEIDFALLLDGLKAEREQGITIDVAYRYFSTNHRKFIIADCPGHEQYTRNMVTGASTANLAIILIDATKGVSTQTRRHTFLVSLLGIKHVVLAINKMDLVQYEETRFNEISYEYKAFVTQLDIPDVEIIPLSALKGDNVVEPSMRMPWFHGKSLMEYLETIHIGSDRNFDDFRFPVQYVNRPGNHFRGYSGKVASGIIRKGDPVKVLPSGTTSRIKSIVSFDGEMHEAFPPLSLTLTLEDEIDISRGDMLVLPDNEPSCERHLEATLVWMDEKPMNPATHFYIKHSTQTTKARIDSIKYRVDVNTLEKTGAELLKINEIGRCIVTTAKPLFFDPYKKCKTTGSFILIDPVSHNTSAVGMIIDRVGSNQLSDYYSTEAYRAKIARGESLIPHERRRERYNQQGATIWITGLHGSGKNELAYLLEKELFDAGATVVLLDGSTIRSGLSRELDFSPDQTAMHLKRVAHIARILNDQGIITICSFISSSAEVREELFQIIGKERVVTVFLDTSLEYCRKTDKGLYLLANEGRIDNLPGVDIPYDRPGNADITVYPASEGIAAGKVIRYLNQKSIFPLT